MKKNPLLLCMLVVWFATGCNKDNTKPNLAIGTPTDNMVFFTPDTFNVDGSLLEGNMDQYKIQLVRMDPCEEIDTTSDGIQFGDAGYLYVSGPNYGQSTFSQTVFIPADFTPAAYYCIVSAIVGQYNEGIDTVSIYIKNITDTIKPVAAITQPTGSVNINKGDTLKINGVVDEKRTSLANGVMRRVKMTLEANFSGQSALTVQNTLNPVNDTLDVDYKIPASISSGSYTLKIVLLDEFNNFTQYTYPVQVN